MTSAEELATIAAKDKTFKQKVEVIFFNFSSEELTKFSLALHVLDDHTNLEDYTVDELWLEITTIIEGRK